MRNWKSSQWPTICCCAKSALPGREYRWNGWSRQELQWEALPPASPARMGRRSYQPERRRDKHTARRPYGMPAGIPDYTFYRVQLCVHCHSSGTPLGSTAASIAFEDITSNTPIPATPAFRPPRLTSPLLVPPNFNNNLLFYSLIDFLEIWNINYVYYKA